VGMGIEQGRAYPGEIAGRSLLDSADNSPLNDDGNVPVQQFFTDKSPSLDYQIPCTHDAVTDFIYPE
jgi:hypothetical protein